MSDINIIEDELWDHYSGLPNPLWYQQEVVDDINFPDRPDFRPTYSPIEMFRMGIFGGCYFKIETDLPWQFIRDSKDLLLYGDKEDKNVNCYGIISGSTLEWWNDRKLIHADDPNGWVEWYVKFYYGRRHSDDDRQIKRFKSFITRHLAMLRGYESKGKDSIKTKQNLLQWAWNHEINPTW